MSTTKTRDGNSVHGIRTHGRNPQELLLSDGSRLTLRSPDTGRVEWEQADKPDGETETVTLGEALALAGDGFEAYVTVRTRSEAAWLRAVAEWCGSEANRLEGELSRN
jgi:hypothetical protein